MKTEIKLSHTHGDKANKAVATSCSASLVDVNTGGVTSE